MYPTNTPRGFHVEMTWKRPFPRRFNLESTLCLCVGVFIVHKIGQNFGVLLATVLGTLGLPYKMPGVASAGQILSNNFCEFFPHS